jgi:hypothetical protein
LIHRELIALWVFARHGVPIERSTLAGWSAAHWWLEPLQARLAAQVFGSTKLFAGDRPVPVPDPGRGRAKDDCGSMPATITRGTGWIHRRRSTSTAPTARPSGRRRTARAFAACCKSMAATFETLAEVAGCPGHRLAHCRRGSAPHRRGLCRREAHPRTTSRSAPHGAAGRITAAHRSDESLAGGAAAPARLRYQVVCADYLAAARMDILVGVRAKNGLSTAL